jgi:hypothetical protein
MQFDLEFLLLPGLTRAICVVTSRVVLDWKKTTDTRLEADVNHSMKAWRESPPGMRNFTRSDRTTLPSPKDE